MKPVTIGGIMNLSNQIAGIAAPIVTGFIVAGTHSYSVAFLAAAARKAAEYEWVPATMKPVTIGAAIPAIWLLRFMMPPIVPTLSRGAISGGMDQATGAAMDHRSGER